MCLATTMRIARSRVVPAAASQHSNRPNNIKFARCYLAVRGIYCKCEGKLHWFE